MSSSTTYINPIPCWSEFDTGGVTPVTLSNTSFVTLMRSDTVRRKKPSRLSLSSGTAGYTDRRILIDGACTYRTGTAPNGVTNHVTVHQAGGKWAIGGHKPSAPPYQDILHNRLRALARGSSANLASALGEYRQTANLFASSAWTVYAATKGLLTRNPALLAAAFRIGSNGRITKSYGKSLSNRVLEWNYGVVPLIGDVNDSIKALKSSAQNKVLSTRLSAGMNWTDGGSYKYSTGNGHWKWKASALVRADVTYKNTVLNTTLGQFGFTNPLSTMWELTPWSHVVDWWINVGEFLASLDNCLYFESMVGQMTFREEYNDCFSLYGGSETYNTMYNSRTSPYMISTVANLSYKPSISKMHILNGVAHLGQLLKFK